MGDAIAGNRGLREITSSQGELPDASLGEGCHTVSYVWRGTSMNSETGMFLSQASFVQASSLKLALSCLQYAEIRAPAAESSLFIDGTPKFEI